MSKGQIKVSEIIDNEISVGIEIGGLYRQIARYGRLSGYDVNGDYVEESDKHFDERAKNQVLDALTDVLSAPINRRESEAQARNK